MSIATKHVEEILTSTFEMTKYVDLVREIFSDVKIIAPDKMVKEYSNFSSHVKASAHVGSYVSPENEKIAVFAVELQKNTYVENSRSTQRSYAKKLIENGGCDAALIAFYTDTVDKWRLSFVVLDYEMKIENGKLKTEEKITPAKRYSYLVGDGEPCHTAISRFGKFIRDNNSQPTLSEIEEAFSVEAVTKEFFDLYCEKFYQLVECLDSNEAFVEEAERCGFSTEQFAKKLLGQIVFLYFLQKKGWLGVGVWNPMISEREYNNIYWAKTVSSAKRQLIQQYLPVIYVWNGNEYKFKGLKALESVPDEVEELIANAMPGDRNWGSGSKTFLRTWFEFAKKKEGRFYDDYLEPLFYATLNTNRGDLGYSSILHCRVPFLSGGLFDPIDGYDWKHTDFNIPNEIFSNRESEDDMRADGILDVFDRYNFTMSEDEPMEREVAIDPEMLGKVFENLLDVKDRKSKGAFYTPREIVHYMCQESLVNYLTTNIDISEDAIRSFILYGDFYKDADTEKTLKVTDTSGKSHYEFDVNRELKISPEIFDPKNGVNRINEIDELLKNIRVADPAVGSGAFPLGMLNEIVRARQNLTAYMVTQKNAYEARTMMINERSAHSLKYETIKNCIFAVDIEPSAVDIARLRLWLALVIDDEINPNAQSPLDGHRNPLPLPNLECNIICGNSLIDEFEGYKLIPINASLGTGETTGEYSWNQMELEALIPKLIDAQDKLFRCEDPIRKVDLKAEIEALKAQMIREQLSFMSPDQLQKYEDSKQVASKPYALWQIEFARVFNEKGGFDVVVGNPPYVQLQKSISDTEKLGDAYAKMGYESFVKTGDLYCLFYEKGYRLLRTGGTLAFITSNKWMRAGYGEKLRGFFAKNTNPLFLIDFAGQKIFESATVDVNILIFEKGENKGNTKACVVKESCGDNLSVYVEQMSSISKFTTPESWVILNSIEASIRRKMREKGTPLSQWNLSINYGIKTGFNDAFIISTEKKDELISADPKSAELIRPILRGRDIKRYEYSFANLWIINVHNGLKDNNLAPINIEEYPAIKAHLDTYYSKLEKRADKGVTPYNLRNCAYMNDFSEQKIVWGNLCLSAQFALVGPDFFVNAPSPMIVPGNKYVLAVLNSKLGDWYIRNLGVTRNGGYFEYKPMFVEQLPVPVLPENEQTIFCELIDKILSAKENHEDSTNYEEEVNSLVYNLYDLTSDEIEFIKNR